LKEVAEQKLTAGDLIVPVAFGSKAASVVDILKLVEFFKEDSDLRHIYK
jgi:hypothetical protein